MTTYILNYLPGCKGDFLCNFINDSKNCLSNIDLSTNKSNVLNGHFKDLSFVKYNKKLLTDQLDQYPNTKIFPCHDAHVIPIKDLEELNLKIINLDIDPEYYNTSIIELAFKQNPDLIYRKYIIKNLSMNNLNSLKHNTKFLLNDVKYHIDLELYKNNIEINDCNRIEYFQKKLEIDIKYSKNITFNARLLNYKNGYTIDYGTIFIDKDFTKLMQFFDIDTKKLSLLIDRTWLPKKITLWGKDFYPSDYGYKY
jgi:hypothetical protein